MVNENGSEDRLTNSEFDELIQHLSMQEILTVEYRIGTAWSKLFSRKNPVSLNFLCHLCALEASSFKNLLAHIDGRKHKVQMERVKQLYHPDYTYPKSYKKEKHGNKEMSEDNKTSNINQEENLPSKKPGVNVQHKTDNSSKSPTGVVNQICENEKVDDDNATSQGNTENDVIIVDVDPKQDIDIKSKKKSLNDMSVIKETKRCDQQMTRKRSCTESYNDQDVDFKKIRIVVNPAAAFTSKKNFAKAKEDKSKESKEKHEYQTDKIIIPKALKNKLNVEKTTSTFTSQTQSVVPKFAIKSYSSNPRDNDIHGMLGVEYVIKILKNPSDISPRYECGLCELVLDGFAMQRHLEGYNHRLKFCEKHFPTAIRQYRQYMQNVPEPEIFKVMTPVLTKLARAIEQHHGRNLPYECYERDFSFNRHEILAKAFSCRHASEQYGPTFTHVVGSKEIDEFINNRHKYLPSSFSRTALFDTKPGSINMMSNNDHNQKNITCNLPDRHRHARRVNVLSDESTHRSYMSSGLHEDIYPQVKPCEISNNRNVQPVDDKTYNLMVDDFLKETLKGYSKNSSSHNTRKHTSPVLNVSCDKQKDDIWQTYRHLVDQELYNLDERFKQYRKEPESHPSYNEEWQQFWKHRKDELVSAGLDHRNYNYQPEWVRFVKIRIEELYDQEAENIKLKARDRLCLPTTNEYVRDEKYHLKLQQRSLSNKIIEYNSKQNDRMTSQTSENNAPQVVSVLRLMTALEDSLGSLGPKIIDLLSQALQFEKINPFHVNAKILNSNNCSLIEIAKEKLKGLIMTGLFEGSKQKVLNQVVKDAEALLQYAYKSKKEFSLQLSPMESIESQSKKHSQDTHSLSVANTLQNKIMTASYFNNTNSASSSTFSDNLQTHNNRKEFASKLAASLVAQGKTDFDPSQLQQLITVYKLIEKKKLETGMASLSSKNSLQGFSTTNKKLSDTLTDLLKPSSSVYAPADVRNISQASNDVIGTSDFNLCSSGAPSTFGNNIPPNSASVLQNPYDNYFDPTARSMSNAFGVNNKGGKQFAQRTDNNINYNSEQLNQHNFAIQNNRRVVQSWGWNTNQEANQNFNMETPNNGFNQSYDRRHF